MIQKRIVYVRHAEAEKGAVIPIIPCSVSHIMPVRALVGISASKIEEIPMSGKKTAVPVGSYVYYVDADDHNDSHDWGR